MIIMTAYQEGDNGDGLNDDDDDYKYNYDYVDQST